MVILTCYLSQTEPLKMNQGSRQKEDLFQMAAGDWVFRINSGGCSRIS
jgi:hypothetical protein